MSYQEEQIYDTQDDTESVPSITPFWKKRTTIIIVSVLIFLFLLLLLFFVFTNTDESKGILSTNVQNELKEVQATVNAQTDPREMLTTIATQLEEAGAFSFQRVAGQNEGFVRGAGSVVLPNKFQEIKYGSPYDLFWVKQKKSTDMTFYDWFPENRIEYLGGFGKYIAFQGKENQKAFYFETMGILGAKILYRNVYVPDGVNVPSDELGVWKEVAFDKVSDNEETAGILIPLFVNHIPEILSSHSESNIDIATTSDLQLLSYKVTSDKFTFNQSFLNSFDKDSCEYEVTVAFNPDDRLQYIEIELYVEQADSNTDTEEHMPYHASRIYITSMDAKPIPTPREGDTEPVVEVEEIQLPPIHPLTVVTREERGEVLELLPISQDSLDDENQIQYKDGFSGPLKIIADEALQVRIYNSEGMFAGEVQSPIVGYPNTFQEISGVRHESFVKNNFFFISLGDIETDDYYLIELQGTQNGTFSFEIEDVSEMYLPTTSHSRGTMMITERDDGTVDINKLHYDVDGDGITDFEISHNLVWSNGESFTSEAQELLDAINKKIDADVPTETDLEV